MNRSDCDRNAQEIPTAGTDTTTYDVVILGQGFAGSAAAWQLLQAGLKPLVIDRGEVSTASRVAAGLITPITGKRLVKSWNFETFWQTAVAYYRSVELATGELFFFERPALRLFQSATERDVFERKRNEFAGLLSPTTNISPAIVAPFGGFEMAVAGQLQSTTYLNAVQQYLNERGLYRQLDIDIEHDIQLIDKGVVVPKYHIEGRYLVCCEGAYGRHNPWFRQLPFNVVKGEILDLSIPGLNEQRVVHAGVWISPLDHFHGVCAREECVSLSKTLFATRQNVHTNPKDALGNDKYRVGATYDWKQLDHQPTHAGAEQLLQRLQRVVRLPCEVIQHTAAVRPAMLDSKPIVGVHPEYPQLLILNGLGSKGTLQAPALGQAIADCLTQQQPLPREFCGRTLRDRI